MKRESKGGEQIPKKHPGIRGGQKGPMKKEKSMMDPNLKKRRGG